MHLDYSSSLREKLRLVLKKHNKNKLKSWKKRGRGSCSYIEEAFRENPARLLSFDTGMRNIAINLFTAVKVFISFLLHSPLPQSPGWLAAFLPACLPACLSAVLPAKSFIFFRKTNDSLGILILSSSAKKPGTAPGTNMEQLHGRKRGRKRKNTTFDVRTYHII